MRRRAGGEGGLLCRQMELQTESSARRCSSCPAEIHLWCLLASRRKELATWKCTVIEFEPTLCRLRSLIRCEYLLTNHRAASDVDCFFLINTHTRWLAALALSQTTNTRWKEAAQSRVRSDSICSSGVCIFQAPITGCNNRAAAATRNKMQYPAWPMPRALFLLLNGDDFGRNRKALSKCRTADYKII